MALVWTSMLLLFKSIINCLFGCCVCKYHSSCCSDEAVLEIDYEKTNQDTHTEFENKFCIYSKDKKTIYPTSNK